MDALRQDLWYAIRQLRRHPGFAFVIIATVGLGVGANTAMFSVVDALLIRPLPVLNPGELVAIRGMTLDVEGRDPVFGGFFPTSYPDFEDYRNRNQSFAGLYVHHATELSLSEAGEPERLFGEFVSGNYFAVLGVEPVLGRGFVPEEDATPNTHPVAVLSHALWLRKFGEDPGVLGRTVRINGHPFTVIGVTPRGFTGTNKTLAISLWVPTMMFGQVAQPPLDQYFRERAARMFFMVGRLLPGVAIDQARADMTALAGQLEIDHPEINRNRSVNLMPLREATVNPADLPLYTQSGILLMSVVGFLLFIASANIANLLLARAVTRRHEVAVRMALGAGRRRLYRQFLTESTLLGLLGGGFGVLLAVAATKLMWAFRPPDIPADALDLSLGGRVLAFAAGISLLTGLLFGSAPVLLLARSRLASLLAQRGVSPALGIRSWIGRPLIAGQVAVCLAALIVAGLLLRSLQAVQRIDPGFAANSLVIVSFHPEAQGWDRPKVREFYRLAVERVAALPEVSGASLTEVRPFSTTFLRTVHREDQDPGRDQGVRTQTDMVGLDYFNVVGIPIISGRPFDTRDRGTSLPVAIPNESAARLLWPGENPVGKRIRRGAALFTVVGLARDAKYLGMGDESVPYIYHPLEQGYAPGATLLVRTTGNAAALLRPVEQVLRRLEPTLPLIRPTTGGALVHEVQWAPRMGAILTTVFGMLALTLVLVGLYGMTSFSVSQRQREVAIRMAVGARPAQLVTQVVREALRTVAIGLAIGAIIALAATRLVSGLLVGVKAVDLQTYAGALLVMIAVALVASYLPARKAARVDFSDALRSE